MDDISFPIKPSNKDTFLSFHVGLYTKGHTMGTKDKEVEEAVLKVGQVENLSAKPFHCSRFHVINLVGYSRQKIHYRATHILLVIRDRFTDRLSQGILSHRRREQQVEKLRSRSSSRYAICVMTRAYFVCASSASSRKKEKRRLWASLFSHFFVPEKTMPCSRKRSHCKR